MAGFYPTNNEVLTFSDDEEDVAKIRFNHYIQRKENSERLKGKLPKGLFYLAENTAALDLNMTRWKIRDLISTFEELGIITRVSKPSIGCRNPSVFRCESVALYGEKQEEKNQHENQHDDQHENRHDKSSDTNGSMATDQHDGQHDDQHENQQSKKQLEKQLEKGIGTTEFLEIVNLYKKHCPRLRPIHKLNDKRKKTLKSWDDLEEIEQVFIKAGKSDFLSGANDRNWAANFDWIINPNNRLKILEGNYDPVQVKQPEQQRRVPRILNQE